MIKDEQIEKAKKAAPPFWRSTDNFDKHVKKMVRAAISAVEPKVKAEPDCVNMVSVIADIREQSGLGAEPMLSELAEAIADKIDGLTADLENAVETAFKRGATEWTRLNYPDQYARLSALVQEGE